MKYLILLSILICSCGATVSQPECPANASCRLIYCNSFVDSNCDIAAAFACPYGAVVLRNSEDSKLLLCNKKSN
jgi:hypothetical protein